MPTSPWDRLPACHRFHTSWPPFAPRKTTRISAAAHCRFPRACAHQNRHDRPPPERILALAMPNSSAHASLPTTEFTTTLAGFLDAHSDATPSERCSSDAVRLGGTPPKRSTQRRIGKAIKPQIENQLRRIRMSGWTAERVHPLQECPNSVDVADNPTKENPFHALARPASNPLAACCPTTVSDGGGLCGSVSEISQRPRGDARHAGRLPSRGIGSESVSRSAALTAVQVVAKALATAATIVECHPRP